MSFDPLSSQMSMLRPRSEYRAREEKQASDGTRVILSQNSRHGWFVGVPGSPAFDPYPLGEFPSEGAARGYADQHFPGGTWQRSRD